MPPTTVSARSRKTLNDAGPFPRALARAAALCTLLGAAIVAQPADHVLDWSEAPPKSRRPPGFFGSRMGAHDELKSLPLEVTIEHIGWRTLVSGDRPPIEVLLKNIGDSPFLLPVERGEDRILRSGHKDVRQMFIGLEVATASDTSAAPVSGGMVVAYGSSSVQGSLLTVLPGETVRITGRFDLFGFHSWHEQGFRSMSAKVRAVVSTADIDPEELVTFNPSDRRKSKNSIEILWKAPGRSQ